MLSLKTKHGTKGICRRIITNSMKCTPPLLPVPADIYIYIYTYIEANHNNHNYHYHYYIYIYIYTWRGWARAGLREPRWCRNGNHGTVSFYKFKSQNFRLSVSNPKSKSVAYLSVLSQISNCQGLGRKNKHDILKTDRITIW